MSNHKMKLKIDLRKLLLHRNEEVVRPRTMAEKIAYMLRFLRKK